jgi:hypothetical protein
MSWPLGRPLSREHVEKLMAVHIRHGHAVHPGSPTYTSWRAMVARCTNPRSSQWDRYGGSGVRVCDRWRRFENFLADMGERPTGKTLDRKSGDGDYEPANCRWATKTQQERNKRWRR